MCGYSSFLGQDSFRYSFSLHLLSFFTFPLSLLFLLLLCFSLPFYFLPIYSPFLFLLFHKGALSACSVLLRHLSSCLHPGLVLRCYIPSVLLICSLFQSSNLLPLLVFPRPSVHIITFLLYCSSVHGNLPWIGYNFYPLLMFCIFFYHHILY